MLVQKFQTRCFQDYQNVLNILSYRIFFNLCDFMKYSCLDGLQKPNQTTPCKVCLQVLLP